MQLLKEKSDDWFFNWVAKINAYTAQLLARYSAETEIISDINTLARECNEKKPVLYRAESFAKLLIALKLVKYKGKLLSSSTYNFFLNNNQESDDIDLEINILNDWQKISSDGLHLYTSQDLVYAYVSLLIKCDRLMSISEMNPTIQLETYSFANEA